MPEKKLMKYEKSITQMIMVEKDKSKKKDLESLLKSVKDDLKKLRSKNEKSL